MFARKDSLSRSAIALLALLSFAPSACRNRSGGEEEVAPEGAASTEAAGSKAAEAQRAMELPVPAEQVQAVVNPSKLPPYTGKFGSVTGIVRVSGDAAPETHGELRGVEARCARVEGMFGHAFREGKDRALADALVAVTGYQGFVSAAEEPVSVRGTGCAWDRRTVAVTFGQRLEISSTDQKAYVPDVKGQQLPAQLFALPGQDPVKIVPRKPGRFTLFDAMRLYNRADLFVLPYPTWGVSDEEGRFTITRVPVGKVRVNAMLPASEGTVMKEIEVKESEATEVELVIPFVASEYKPNFDPSLKRR